MKEYLDKQSDGTYKIIKVDSGCVDRDWVEAPKDVDTFVELLYVKGFFFFFKTKGNLNVWDNTVDCWKELNNKSVQDYLGDYTVLWERTECEESTYASDFEIATGYRLDTIGNVTYGARSRISGETDTSYREYLRSIIKGTLEESLKDNRVEYFEKFLNGEKIQYRIGSAVGNPESQWHNLTWNALKDMKHTLIEFRETPKYVTINIIEFKTTESLLKHVKNNYDLES